MPPDVRFGRYTLQKKLGVGGMAEVFLARAEGALGFTKSVVLKRILPHFAADPQFLRLFRDEAQLASRLDHQNLVHVFDFGEAEGAPFIAMEYVEGANLSVLAPRTDEGFACAVIARACEGLAFAHELRQPESNRPLRLVHRDVSPDNILLGRSGAVKVSDFGIARAFGLEARTQTGVLRGKLHYMAPEQLRGEELDLRADLYSLGVVFYELLTGARPFDVTSELAQVDALLHAEAIPARARRADVPEALEAMLSRALAKDRDDRYSSCRELQSDLEAHLFARGLQIRSDQLGEWVRGAMAKD